jgi:putative methionine-R-sulfoxide reductase with GAF domain
MSTPDADEQLRQAVAGLAARDECDWAGIYFVEDGELVLGPEAGTPDPARRTSVPVSWRDTRVAEIAADGTVARSDLEELAVGIADLCLVGWDTGGELWQS